MDKKKNSMKKKKISRTKKEERVLHNLYQIKNIVLFNLNFFFSTLLLFNLLQLYSFLCLVCTNIHVCIKKKYIYRLILFGQ